MKLPSAYTPKDYESDIYALWEKSDAFLPKKRGGSDNYSITVPPPNANGDLHLGHALTLALEDISIRYNRMLGNASLLVPGADHAGFETQVVYEKVLESRGQSRFDFKREELYDQIYDFVASNRENYQSQFRKLGASVDWSRYVFTLDEKIVNTAYQTFKKMWDDKLIYRGERLVNYCTNHRTGFADIEVNYEDATSPLYYIKYGPFTLATTRPETKFGDTAVAVHPSDKRYKEWVGKNIKVEGANGPFEVMVIADEMVDPDFGTGAVKITPAHSFDDWEVAQRHNLPAVRVINHDGTMNEKAGKFRGMKVLDARKAVAEALKEKGLLEKVDETYQNRVGKCYKCGTVIEPMLLKQWFIDMKPLTKPAIKALKDNKIKFHPSSKKDQLIKYLEGLHDWNISRQIAWGIPIPAFVNIDDSDDWIYDERVDQEFIEVGKSTYRRDPDVFDTWFSSASWPYATLGYPSGQDYKDFYPLSLMETGSDILYPWVSRMIMFGLYNTGQVPFKKVYLHGLILDPKGQKMSKSKGNVVNPMDIVDQYGSDAMRIGVILGQSAGQNQPFGTPKVVSGRNYCNKLWNIARFTEGKIDATSSSELKPTPTNSADYYILSSLQHITEVVSSDLDNYRYSEAFEALYHFVWDELADWYIEVSKKLLNVGVLDHVLKSVLKLSHPFAPFVTETIWQTLVAASDNSKEVNLLATSAWPKPLKVDSKKADEFEQIKQIVSEIRFIKSVLNVTGVKLYHKNESFLNRNADLIKALTKTEVAEVSDGHGLHLTTTNLNCWLDLDQNNIRAFLHQLQLKLREYEQDVVKLEARLSNKSYVKNAPKELVSETKQQLEKATALRDKSQKEYDRFSTSSS